MQRWRNRNSRGAKIKKITFLFFPRRLQLPINHQAGHWFPLGEGESSLLLLCHSHFSTGHQSQWNHPHQRIPADQMDQNRAARRNHRAGGAKRSHQNRLRLQEPRVCAQPPRRRGRRHADHGQATRQRRGNVSLWGRVRHRGHPGHSWPWCQR